MDPDIARRAIDAAVRSYTRGGKVADEVRLTPVSAVAPWPEFGDGPGQPPAAEEVQPAAPRYYRVLATEDEVTAVLEGGGEVVRYKPAVAYGERDYTLLRLYDASRELVGGGVARRRRR